MYATSVVSARKASNGDSEKLGDISYAQSVHVTGRDKNTGWYRIEFEGGEAYVSDSYLSDTKPVVQTPQNNNSNSSSSSNSDCASSDCSSDCAYSSDCNCASNIQDEGSYTNFDHLRETDCGW